tara:strand:+ start:1154 stop:1336 length:183 start_codon:yes stop_codon:yes gene_type:complete
MPEINIDLRDLNTRLKLQKDLSEALDQIEIFELMLMMAKQQGFFDGYHWDSRIECWERND